MRRKSDRRDGEKLSRDTWMIFLATALGSAALMGAYDLLRVLYMLRLGYGAKVVGATFAAGALSFCAASVPGGVLGAKWGARRMLIVGIVGMTVGMCLLQVTEALPERWRMHWFVLVQLVTSAGWSLFIVNHLPVLCDVTSPAQRRGAFAAKEAVAGMGVLAGAFVGGLLPGLFARVTGSSLQDPLPYRLGLVLPALLAMGGLVPVLALPQSNAVLDPAAGQDDGRPRLALVGVLIVGAFMANGAAASVRAFASAFLDQGFGLPPATIGIVTSVGTFLAVIASLSSVRLGGKRGSGGTLVLGAALMSVNLLILSVARGQTAAAVGVALALGLEALWRPAFQALQMQVASQRWRPMVSGAGAAAMSLGFGAVSFGGGRIVTLASYDRLFLLGAGLAFGALLAGLLLSRGMARADRP